MSNLMLHSGGKVATLDEVRNVSTPAAVGRWHPTAHATVLDSVRETLTGAGYTIRAEKYALARNDQRFFGILDLETPLVTGVGLSVGLRNSTDKSFPLGFAAGSRVFVCDNLAFSAELMVRRKHTRFGLQRFGNAIAEAVTSLASFRDAEAGRIRRLAAANDAKTLQQIGEQIARDIADGRIPKTEKPALARDWAKRWKEVTGKAPPCR